MKRTMISTVAIFCVMVMAGVAWAEETDTRMDGTVTDPGTGLVWLQDAGCLGRNAWYKAKGIVKDLKSGSCGLTDGSAAGQWRLPTKEELEVLAVNLRNRTLKEQFKNIPDGPRSLKSYWSSSAGAERQESWKVEMPGGYASEDHRSGDYLVWPVRAGQ